MELLAKEVARFVKLPGKNFLLVRHGESLANYSGVLHGFSDTKLTIKGREQAHKLFRVLSPHLHEFKSVHSSDLIRSLETANISLGFPSSGFVIVDKRLREINFGRDENIHYDSLSQEKKDAINDISYQADGGESWSDVKKRCLEYFQTLPAEGNYLVYTHGGLMCTLTWQLGLRDCLPNTSLIGLGVDPVSREPNLMHFYWCPPSIEEI